MSIDVAAGYRRAFSETSDPEAYVPRTGTNEVLDALHAWSESDALGSTVAALFGTPGLGKTMMLRVMEYGLNRPRDPTATDAIHSTRPSALYLPYASLDLVDLCHWVHGLLGRTVAPNGGASDEEWAIERLKALGDEAEAPFYLLFDDADAMPSGVIRAFLNDLPLEHSPLRVLVAVNPDSKGSRLVASLNGLAPTEFALRDRMTIEETADYLRQRMRWAGLPEAECDRIDQSSVHRIHSLSSGVPRAIHRLATSLFEGDAGEAQSAVDEKRRREDWMGQPISDEL